MGLSSLHKINERRLFGLSGLLGVLMLGVSFAINQGPPPGATDFELHAFAARSFREVMLAGWLQAVGPALLAAFVFGVIGGLPNRWSWLASMARFGITILMMVSLGEVSLYFAALYPVPVLGIPKEGVGASNDAKGHLGPPKFKDAMFRIDATSRSLLIHVNYL